MIIDYPIPANTNILVKEDSKLDFNTPLLEKKINTEISVDLAKKLKINPKNIFRYLKKLVGESINKGDLIALNKGIFFKKKFISPYDGIIKEIDHHRGTIIIELIEKEKKQFLSPFKGQVIKITKNSIQIKVGKYQEFSIKKTLNDFGGEILYIDPDTSINLSADNTEDKIIVAEKINSFIQVKAEALGIKGFVTLQNLPQKTDINSVLLKNIDDFKKIIKNKFSYCIIISKSDKIYFYQ